MDILYIEAYLAFILFGRGGGAIEYGHAPSLVDSYAEERAYRTSTEKVSPSPIERMTFPSISEEDLAMQVALGANQGNQNIENGGEIKLLGDSRDVQMEPYTIPAGGGG